MLGLPDYGELLFSSSSFKFSIILIHLILSLRYQISIMQAVTKRTDRSFLQFFIFGI